MNAMCVEMNASYAGHHSTLVQTSTPIVLQLWMTRSHPSIIGFFSKHQSVTSLSALHIVGVRKFPFCFAHLKHYSLLTRIPYFKVDTTRS